MVVLRKRRPARALKNDCSLPAKVSQSVDPALSPKKIWKSLPTTPMLPQRGNIGRQPQAGAAAHACTEIAARNAPCRSFPAFASLPGLSAISKPDNRHPHDTRRAAQPQGETGGCGGNYFPRMAFRGARGSAPDQIPRNSFTGASIFRCSPGRNQRMRLSARNQVHCRLA